MNTTVYGKAYMGLAPILPYITGQMAEKGVDKGLSGKEVLWRKRGLCNNKNNCESKLTNISEPFKLNAILYPPLLQTIFFNITSLT